jgi:preprotein translocase SecE subunit
MKKFFTDRIAELHNVTWPTNQQAVHSMITVLVIMLLVGIFLGVIDYFFNEGILSLLNF